VKLQECMGCGKKAKVNKNAKCEKCVEKAVYETVRDRMDEIDANSPDNEQSWFPEIFWQWIEQRVES
jgi:hypothetical protein